MYNKLITNLIEIIQTKENVINEINEEADKEANDKNIEQVETKEQFLEEDQLNDCDDSIEGIKDNKKIIAKKVGTLDIPKINLEDKSIYEGTELEILEIGIGHFTNTSIFEGNVGLASHNAGENGSEFKNLKNIELGDKIYYKTEYGTKTYSVEKIIKISDEDWSYLEETNENKITLLTCVSGEPNSRLCVQGIEIK